MSDAHRWSARFTVGRWTRPAMIVAVAVVVLTLLFGSRGQSDAVAEPTGAVMIEPALVGAIDIHTHPAPDSQERTTDVIEFANLARAHGMRGFVVKQHHDHTAGTAYLVRRVVPDLEVFGVLVLNRAMGGINVAAVERFARTAGGWGRIVSMPTFDAALVPVSRGGELLPEVVEVLRAIATIRTVDSDGRLTLATGHVTPDEGIMLVREGKRLGVDQVMITHPWGRWSVDQMREVAAMGALLEFTAATVIIDETGARMAAAAEAIRAIGPESVIISSDLGRADLPRLHPEGLAAFAAGLRSNGFTDAQLLLMTRNNPARLLGLGAWAN